MFVRRPATRRPTRRQRPLVVASGAPRSRAGRRGATAMEYVVIASFIFVIVFAGIQHLGAMLGNSYQDSAQKLPSGK